VGRQHVSVVAVVALLGSAGIWGCEAAASLADDDFSFITATTFLVDGGIFGAHVTPR
jgi:hypothetical protein